MPIEKLCGVNPEDLVRLGITHEDGMFRDGALTISDERVLKLIRLLHRGDETRLTELDHARAFVRGLSHSEVELVLLACQESMGHVSRTVLPSSSAGPAQPHSKGVW
jgi:hypothetical protein